MRANRRLQADERGVSEVIGAILVFGLAITLLAVLQTQAVPAANEDVEFNHNQEVQSDLVEFQSSASRTAASGSTESVKIQMGTNYPSRLLFFNPRNPSGDIRTVEDGTVTITNIRASDATVRKHIDGSLSGLETKRIEYRPQYNEFKDSPTTVLEYGTLYNDFGNTHLIQDEGNVVNGNHIDLMFFTGDLQQSTGGALSITSQPASAPARTVTVEPESGNDITIEIPSRLSAADWEGILDDEIQNGNVKEVNSLSGNRVEIVLDGSVSHYTMRLPVIGVGSNVEQPDPVYVIGANGHSATVPQGSVKEVTFEVRDKYNNPVRDEDLNVWLDSSAQGSIDGSQSTTVRTDENGQATVQYESPSSANTPLLEEIHASFVHSPGSSSFSAANNPEDYIFEMTVVERQFASGPPITADIQVDDTDCAGTGDGGLAGTTLLGGEAADVKVMWSASTSAPAEVSDVSIKMIDDDNGQVAASTSYSPDSTSASETIVLRDQRPDKRSNGESCEGTYTLRIDATTDKGRHDSGEDTADFTS